MSKFKSNKSKSDRKGTKEKQLDQQTIDLLEQPEALADRLLDTEKIISRNKYLLGGILGVIVLVVGGYFFYQYTVNSQESDAQVELYPAEYYFKADSFNLALKGNENYAGFEEIAEDYSMSPAGNLANFYAGISALKKGDFKLAIEFLNDFSTSDPIIQARAYSAIGDAQMELDKYQEAASFYNKAASYRPNEYFTPLYLIKLALAQEKKGDFAAAVKTYEKIIKEYPKSSEITNAKKFKGRAEAMSKK